jgi:RecA-family ATPase
MNFVERKKTMIVEKFSTLARRTTHIDWIVDGLLSSGAWTYFVGEAGSGKSMLCIQLCNAIQEGKPFLGMKCKKRNCLYVQVDTGRLEWQEQVSRLAPDGNVWTMYALADLFLDNPQEVETVKSIIWGTYPISDEPNSPSQVLKHVQFDFIVFDVLNKLTRVDLNTKPSMSHVLERLEYMTTRGTGELKENKHFVLVHHPSKTTKRGVDAGAGYSGFGGLCGNMLTLGHELLVLTKSKVVGRKEILLERNPETGAWRLAGDPIEMSHLESIDDLVEAFKMYE